MSDIVKRLRDMAEADYYGRDQPHFVPPEDCADEIERLQARAERAEAALDALEASHQTFRLDNDREWKAKVDYQKARAEKAEMQLISMSAVLEGWETGKVPAP